MKVQNIKNIVFLFILLIGMPLLVDAKSTSSNEICINTDSGTNFYEIKSKGKSVVPFYITYNDIVGNNKYPALCYCEHVGDTCLQTQPTTKKDSLGNNILDTNGNLIFETPGTCKKDYQFKVESQSLSCKISSSNNDNYEFYLCPDNNSYDIVGKMQQGMNIEYISSSNQYLVTFSIPDNFRGKISAKLLTKKGSNTSFDIDSTTGLPNAGAGVNKTPNEINTGIYFIPGTEFYFVFYLSDSNDGCNGERLGYIMGAVPSNVPNPMYNDSICTNFRRTYTSGTVERVIVSECDETTIQYNELSTIRSIIVNKIAELEKLHQQMETNVNTSNNFTCLFENNSNTVNIQNGFSTKAGFLDVPGTGKYWKPFCEETISIEYDDPKATYAGGGFGYNAKLTVDRTCRPVKISEPKYLPNCQYSVECWGGPAEHSGESGAGPNEDFDNCINTCDGGTYTQNCINSCYNAVYKSSSISYSSRNRLTNTTFIEVGKKNYQIARLASSKGNPLLIGTTDGGQTKLPISSGCIISGNNIDNGCGTSCNSEAGRCTTEHGITFIYYDSCNANGEVAGTKCYEVYLNYPCDDGVDYRKDILESETEYNLVVQAIQEFSNTTIQNEEYQIIIDEDYNQQKNGSYQHKTTIFSNKNRDYSVHAVTTNETYPSQYLSSTNIANPNVGNLSSEFINEHVNNKAIYNYHISRTIDLNIGTAYVSRVNGNDVVYNKTSNLTDSSLDNNKKYEKIPNRYFTSLDTRLINNYRNWPYYNNAVTSDSTDIYTKNIHVRFYNIGSWNQWGTTENGVNVDCLYGVAPGLIIDECIPDNFNDYCCPDCDKGVQWIYRVIDLEDVFPNNRNPRWNWTGTLNRGNNTFTGAARFSNNTYLKYNIDPIVVTEDIESKGYTIYDVKVDPSEVDYEFVLTTENLRNIRNYNKNVRDYNGDSYHNYLDYNMSCYTNSSGKEICTSRFMDNVNGNSGTEASANFITYSVPGFTIDTRKNIAGCNNSKSGVCIDISR